MEALWGRLSRTVRAAVPPLLCLSVVIALAACGVEQAAPAVATTVSATPMGTAAPATTVDPAAEPQPTATLAQAETPVPLPMATPMPTPTPTPTATPPPTSTPTPAHTPTPTPTPTPTATPQPTSTPTPTHTPTPLPTATPQPTSTPEPKTGVISMTDDGMTTSTVKFISYENGVLNIERAGEVLKAEYNKGGPRRFRVRVYSGDRIADIEPEQVIPGRSATLYSRIVGGKEFYISLVVDSAGGVLPAALINNDSLYKKISGLQWYSDGVSEDEASVLYALGNISQIDDALFAKMLDLPWVTDGITRDERQGLDSTEGAMQRIGNVDSIGPVLLGELIGKEWFRDGLNDEEIALVIVLRSFVGQESVFRDLISDNSILSETVSLPLAGETKLFVVSRSSITDGDRVLWAASIGLKAMEGFMGEPWPKQRVIFALEPEWNSSSFGANVGDHILLKHTGGFLILHELAHDYLTSISSWIDEGGAHFLATYTAGVHEGSVQEVQENAAERLKGSVARCAESGASNIQKWLDVVRGGSRQSKSSVAGCHYALGEAFLLGMYQSLGHDVVSSSLRELYNLKQERWVDEGDIYGNYIQTLTNQPD